MPACSIAQLIQQHKNITRMIESIDDKLFYSLASDADTITRLNVHKHIIELSSKIFNKTGVDKWFNDKGLKRKTKLDEKKLSDSLNKKLQLLEIQISYIAISEILKEISKLPDIKCYRKEILSTFCKALEKAEFEQISVYKAMVQQRNLVRRSGRNIYGKCVGTTLLTKGLEFETVVIINAHKFKCPKHLYVAMTRASKRLVIFSESHILNPH